MPPPLSLAVIRRALAGHQPRVLPVNRPHAAVAMVLTETAAGSEVLFIVRASHDRDPWSGDIGFPGGRVAAADGTPRQTAERETAEELKLTLTGSDYLGRLDDLYGATLPILVSAFVYCLPEPPRLVPNHEVARVFWFPLRDLSAPERHSMATFPWRGAQTTQPVITLLDPGGPLLWGITYRLLGSFFTLLQVPFGESHPPITRQT
jgi:8-oxo-dGTP pyrophosphatase MutT (NUDIX family)